MKNLQKLTVLPGRKPTPLPAGLEQSLKLLSEGVVIVTQDFIIEYINGAAQQLLKLAADSVITASDCLLSWSIKEQNQFIFHTLQDFYKSAETSVQRRFYNYYNNQWVHLHFEKLAGEAQQTCIILKAVDDHAETTGFEDLINTIDGIVWEADALTFEISFVSEQAAKVLGYPLATWYEAGFWKKYIHPEDVDEVLDTCAALTRQGADHTLEYRMIAADGRVLWFKDVVRIVKESGRAKAIRGLLINITEEKMAVQLLAEKEEWFKAIVHHSFDATALLSADFNIKYVSPSISKILGYEQDELLNTNGFLLVKEDMRPDAVEKFKMVLADADMDAVEMKFIHKNGSFVLVEILGKSLLHNSYVNGVLLSIRDITEKRRLEQELIKAEVTQVRMTTQAVIKTQEKERKKIANELHDNINQLLSAAKLMLDTARDVEPLREKLMANSSETLAQAINEIRLLTSSLVVYDIQDLGIYESVHKLIANLSLTSTVKAVAKINKEVDELLDGTARTHLYRIIQEHLTNVHKHSKATKVLLTISVTEGKVTLTIRDNGVGFDLTQKRKGIGLSNISHRVQILNGTFTIDAEPGKGCLLSVVV